MTCRPRIQLPRCHQRSPGRSTEFSFASGRRLFLSSDSLQMHTAQPLRSNSHTFVARRQDREPRTQLLTAGASWGSALRVFALLAVAPSPGALRSSQSPVSAGLDVCCFGGKGRTQLLSSALSDKHKMTVVRIFRSPLRFLSSSVLQQDVCQRRVAPQPFSGAASTSGPASTRRRPRFSPTSWAQRE